jgi:hypothetical protein
MAKSSCTLDIGLVLNPRGMLNPLFGVTSGGYPVARRLAMADVKYGRALMNYDLRGRSC